MGVWTPHIRKGGYTAHYSKSGGSTAHENVAPSCKLELFSLAEHPNDTDQMILEQPPIFSQAMTFPDKPVGVLR